MRERRRERLTLLLSGIGFTAPADRAWRERAGCVGTDPETFFPLENGQGVAAARLVCVGCSVRRECLADAMASEDPAMRWGVVGGLTSVERAELFDRQRRAVA